VIEEKMKRLKKVKEEKRKQEERKEEERMVIYQKAEE
jgi:hypothetical protein